MPKSMKTAFIRVTKVNNTEQGVVSYTQGDIKDILDEWSFTSGIDYWFIDHVPDDDDPNDHFHIVIKFRNPVHFDTVKNKFPYGHIDTARNVKRAVQYLIHMNDPEKIQYKWDDVVTNCHDLTPFKVQSRSQQDVGLQRVFERIESGEVTMFNYAHLLPIDLVAKNKSVIVNAIQCKYDRLSVNHDRDIKVLYFYGRSGLGKTTFAKRYFESMGYNYAITSGSNDPLQDYKGESGLLWDDFRDSQFPFSDLLKFFDPNTRSSGKSRYFNKQFLGDVIIMTSTRRMEYLYKEYRMKQPVDDQESMSQLRRRIQEYYEFFEDRIDVYLYNKWTGKYDLMKRFANPLFTSGFDVPPNVLDETPFENMGLTLVNPEPVFSNEKIGKTDQTVIVSGGNAKLN